MVINIIGWIGSACFAICGAPQAWLSYTQGHSKGVDKTFLWLWLVGELCMIVYVPTKLAWDWPIMVNLVLNTFFILVIMKYAYYPKEI